MNKSIKKIENKLKKTFSFKRMNPHVYWTNLLYAFSVITIVLIILSIFLLFRIKNQQIFQVEIKSEETKSLVNEKFYNEITRYFNDKLLRLNEVKQGTVFYSDPSY